MKRIILWSLFLALAPSVLALPRIEATQVNLDYVARLAEQRARKPFHSPRADLPEFLRNLTYDSYREIEFRHEKALWLDERAPFRVEFFHPGYLYQEPVHCNEFTATAVQSIRFVQDFFDYRQLRMPQEVPANTGYAGFRILHPLNVSNKWDELGSFLGASYFRLLGAGQTYGISARGLAIDCGGYDRPEEFPLWTDWWLGKPQRDDKTVLLYAILDSVSCVGAYQFLIQPNQPRETTIAGVKAVVYFREENLIHAVDPQHKPPATLGMAPLTSMFWFGENSEQKFDDYRPEVHDSDGLLMQLDGEEMLWRPLDNGPVMRHQVFAAKHLHGFGLLQRDRNFNSYQDLFNSYQSVPSVWVEPRGTNWDDGEIHLVELSTHYEGLDNIVAFWNPVNKPKPLQPFRFDYDLYWTRETDMTLSSNRVVSTRVGADPKDARQRQFVIDWDIPAISSEDEPPTAVSSCGTNAAIVGETRVYRNHADKTWRVMLNLAPKEGNKDPVDLRCTLKGAAGLASETWTYLWSPP
ncbi:MAG: glucan biosynthesis protein G [Verrucomicrobiota bacterium]|jgi:glucans biosynthesis protein